MSKKGLGDRKRLTFEQAEGVEPLIPAQLQPQELSKPLRARLWVAVYQSITQCLELARMFGEVDTLHDPWLSIFFRTHIYRNSGMIDEFDRDPDVLIASAKTLIQTGDYISIFGWLQWILRQKDRPAGLARAIDDALREGHAAYRVVDDDTIMPIGSEAERNSIETAFADLASVEFHGARGHLRKAAEELTAGRCADSVRESIHAVESVARVLEPSAELGKALAKLQKSVKLHSAMKNGFSSLYGYTSDEKGIRHPMLDKGDAAVDEIDALFMIGACASFVSYLINKAKQAKVI